MEAYGRRELTFVDRFGVHLSRRPILNVVRRYAEPDVLDVGCGFHAELLVDLEPRVRSGVGIDQKISDGAKGTDKLTFLEGTVEGALPKLEGRTFDVITIISVLEHLWEPLDILTRLRRLLRPEGSLVVNVPNWLGKELLELSAFRLRMSPFDAMDDHKMYYDKRDLWPLLVRAGFRPSRIAMRYHKLGLNLFAVARAD